MLEQLSSAGSMRPMKQHPTFGVVSLPSDDITALMHNKFNRDYIKAKFTHDDTVNMGKNTKTIKQRTVRDTNANRLLADAQQAKARNMEDGGVRASADAVMPSPRSGAATSLPPIKGKMSVNASQPSMKPSQLAKQSSE